MRVFLTGGTGLVGRRVASALLEAGHEVIALVRNPAKASLLPKGTEIHLGDVLLPGTLRPALRQADAVVHAAALVDYGAYPAEVTLRVNYLGTLNVFREAERAGVRRGVFVSSIAALGAGEPGEPLRDENALLGRPLKFTSAYELSKFAATLLVRRRFPWAAVLYLGVVWGPGSQVELGFRQPFFVSSDARTALVHVDDAAQAILLALEKELSGDYLCVSETLSLQELGRALGKTLFVPHWLVKASALVGSFLKAFGVSFPLNPTSISMALADWGLRSERLLSQGWRPRYNIAGCYSYSPKPSGVGPSGEGAPLGGASSASRRQ